MDVIDSPVNAFASVATIEGPTEGETYQIKIDQVFRVADHIFILGWTTLDTADISVNCRGDHDENPYNMKASRLSVERADVAVGYGLARSDIGFVLDIIDPDATELSLQIDLDKETQWQCADIQVSGMPQSINTGLGCNLLQCVPAGSQSWREIIQFFSRDNPPSQRTAEAHFTGAFGSLPGIGGGAWGWVVYEANTHVWLMDEYGNVDPIENANRSDRPDVLSAMTHIAVAETRPGFHIALPNLEAKKKVAIRAISPNGTWTVAQTAATTLATDIPSAMKTLFAIHGSPSDLKTRANHFELPIAQRLLQHNRSIQATFNTITGQIGEVPSNPEVSVIIPLYGRMDFIEHQLMEFQHDPYMIDRAEIIYAIDDPAIFEQLPLEAEGLFKLYETPFRWVWGAANRGFSGANNLGASIARAPRLLFLNSDAFPTRAGWLQDMADTLDENPDYGMIAPRLLFADGSIQHAGMVNRYHAHLGVWINHHPLMGFDPDMDPHDSLTEMPLVTGACMLMQRDVFDQLDGWDTDYIIGDYEDSDLCFKVRDAGLKVGYLPSVELVHLERQSFKLFGEDSERFRITLANAIRHQTRWQKFITSDSETITP